MLATTPSRSTPGAGLTEAGSDYRALAEYFDALYFCDVETLRRVFHPRAIYATADERPLLYRTMEEYTAVVAARQSPGLQHAERERFQLGLHLERR